MISRIISGMQSGVDLAAVEAAKEVGIPTGGWMPKGFITLDGPKPEYAELYNAKELDNESYAARTRQNVYRSNYTIQMAADYYSSGEICTATAIKDYGRPYHRYTLYPFTDHNNHDKPALGQGQSLLRAPTGLNLDIVAGDITRRAESSEIIINVAGNSERTCPGIHDFAFKYFLVLFEGLRARLK